MFDKLFRKNADPLDAAHAVALKGLPRDWSTVWLQVECQNGGSRTSVDRFVSTHSTPKPTYDKTIDDKAFGIFADLAQQTTPPWTTCTLRYDRDAAGNVKTKADFGYDPVPADYRHDRRLAWKKHNLPEGS